MDTSTSTHQRTHPNAGRADNAQAGNRKQSEALDLDPSRTPTVNISDAARHLGISRSTAYMAADAGHIPTIRVGLRRRVVPTAALLRMLDLPVRIGELNQPVGTEELPSPNS